MSLQRVHDYIDRHFADHLRRTQDFLRIESTRCGTALNEAARWLIHYLRELGSDPELIGPKDAPIVFARLDAGKPKTLLVYGMYDVQPVKKEDWSSLPFAADIADKPDVGPAVIARGACNSKGPLASFLNALQSIRKADTLPVNLILTIEGEEESGSHSLPEFYRQSKTRLKADAAFEPFWAEYGTDVDRPTIALGTKGVVSCEAICRGGSWGGPTGHPVHSSVGAWIASPTWRLLKALSTLLDEHENIAIADFCVQVKPPKAEDELLLNELQSTFDAERVLKILNAKRFNHDLSGVDLLRHYLFSPTLQVLMASQDSGDIIPSEARAEIVARLVPEMDPDRTVGAIRGHLSGLGYADIEIVKIAGYPASRTNLHDSVVQSLIAAYRFHGVEPQIWPLLASATPYYLFSDVLGIPYVWGGLGRAGGSHSVDEFASVSGLQIFEKSIATFLYEFGES